MTLPLTDLKFSQINSELSRTSTASYTLDDAEGRKLASAGLTGQSLTAGTSVKASNFLGHALNKYTRSATPATNINVFTDVSGSNYSPGKTYVAYTVASGVVIGSTSTSTSAMSLTGFVSGDIVEIVNNGTIVGHGGDGGGGGGKDAAGGNGSNGGPALSVSTPTLITNNGAIWGGGGGGGGGAGDHYFNFFGGTSGVNGGSGGGGAGYLPGTGYQSGTTATGGNGQPRGGQAGDGGRGGNPGTNGSNGGPGGFSAQGGIGGNAGASITGISNATLLVEGDIRGSRI